MPYLFIFTMIVMMVVFFSLNREIDQLKKNFLNNTSNKNDDSGVGVLWDAIADLQLENQQLHESLAKHGDSIMQCEKSLHEIDELLGDIATKKDLEGNFKELSEHIKTPNSEDRELNKLLGQEDISAIQVVGARIEHLSRRIKKLEADTKKPQARKPGAKLGRPAGSKKPHAS